MSLRIEGLRKNFGHGPVLNGIDLAVEKGEFLALLGPSGSGKTSLLRIIAGLESASAGRLLIDGNDALNLPPGDRRMGSVFQTIALIRHMRGFDNIAFGITVKARRERPSASEIGARVDALLDLVQLQGLGRRFPSQLSGGQRQRVALARALAVRPEILLLDEPFGALDTGVRIALRDWLRALHDRLELISIFVTHDREEALALADRIAVLNAGRIEQVGTPAELYDEPASAFVMGFLGQVNPLACTVQDGQVRSIRETPQVPPPSLAAGRPPQGAALAPLRPHDLRIVRSAEPAPPRPPPRSLAGGGARLHIIPQRSPPTLEGQAAPD